MLGEKMSLSHLVEYQKDAIVSKTLIDKSSGTVTLFAFDEGQGLSEHTAPYDAMVLVLEGLAEVKIEEKLFKVEAGEMIIMPANKSHALRATSKFKMLLVMIKS